MQFFIDTADVTTLRSLAETGFVDGVTTNPTLIARSGRSIHAVIEEICSFISGPVSAEVVAMDYEGMVREGKALRAIAPNVAVKLPMTMEGLKACRFFSSEGIMTNVTLCFTPMQALMAARAGASFVSPFVGRLDDIGQDGMNLIADIASIFNHYPELNTRILVASVRHAQHVLQAAHIGADVVTIPPALLPQLLSHPLTDRGIEQFLRDWQSTGTTII